VKGLGLERPKNVTRKMTNYELREHKTGEVSTAHHSLSKYPVGYNKNIF
jgi:hypothetical protein